MFQRLEVVAHTHQACQHLCTTVGTIAVGIDDFLGCSQLEATFLHQVVNQSDYLDVLFSILTYFVGSGSLGLQIGKLCFPETQRALVEAKHLGHLLDGVVELEVFVQIQCHIE